MLLLSSPVYKIWMRDTIDDIPFIMSLICMLCSCVLMSTNVYVNALCGAGYLRLQMIFCIISPVAFVVLCYLFIKVFQLGVWSVPLANLIANIYGLIVAPWQCYQVFFRKKKGILVA